MSWDAAEALPLLLNDGTSSFVYGPGGLPIEQIAGETAQYLHHDQQGSTRLLTGASGTVAGTTTFDAYGNKIGSTGSATSTLGYDGQYTSADTGLIYLRARVYDPVTAQFLSVDPVLALSGEPYGYAVQDPLAFDDPAGDLAAAPALEVCIEAPEVCAGGALVAGIGAAVVGPAKTRQAIEGVLSAVSGNEGASDEGAESLADLQVEEDECIARIPTGAKSAPDALKDLAKRTGIPRGKLSKAFHKLKDHFEIPPGANTRIDSEGNVYDAETGQEIGNILDEAGN